MKLMEITKLPGTFAGVHFDDKTKDNISKYIKDNDIPNGTSREDMHITLLHSKKHLPNYKPLGTINEKAIPDKFTIFKNNHENSNCLVLLVNCPFLHKRFKELMDEHNATYDFDEYLPHVTFSYDVGNYDYSSAVQFTEPLKLIEEYKETLSK